MEHDPTPDELAAAHRAFEAIEPRSVFYRAATALVELAIRGQTSLKLEEALAVLLQTWNRGYYQYHQRFDAQHFADIERAVNEYHDALMRLRPRAIERFAPQMRILCARSSRALSACWALLALRSACTCSRRTSSPFGIAVSRQNMVSLWDRRETMPSGIFASCASPSGSAAHWRGDCQQTRTR